MDWVSKLIPKGKIPWFIILAAGFVVVVAALLGKVDYKEVHFALEGAWRIAALVFGILFSVVAMWLLIWAPEQDDPQSVSVDLSEFTNATKKKIRCPLQSTVDDFLDKLYLQGLRGAVSAHSYGSEWILNDSQTGRQYRNIGASWARGRGNSTDNRPLADVGIYAGSKLSVISAKGGLVVDAQPYLGGNQQPKVFDWNQLTTAGNFLNLVCNELIPEESPQDYNVSWMLVSIGDGREFSSIKPGDSRRVHEVGLREDMRLVIRKPKVQSPVKDEASKDFPPILHQPLLARRDALGPNQSKLLTYIRDQSRGNSPVRQETIEKAFTKLGDSSSIFYRLEVLYLMGLIEKSPAGLNDMGRPMHLYTLSAAYKAEIPENQVWDQDSPSRMTKGPRWTPSS
jgi:hypothetical protein